MRHPILVFLITLFTFFNSDTELGVGGTRKKNPVNVHVISIGIDRTGGFYTFKNCANDAKALVEKIKQDKAPHTNTTTTRGPSSNKTTKIAKEGDKGHTAWAANPDLFSASCVYVPFFEHPIHTPIYEAREKGEKFMYLLKGVHFKAKLARVN